MYESPIQMIVDEIQTQMIQQEEDQLMMQVQKSLGFDIDKNELLRALNYDRDQYEKGYKDGRHDASWIPVSERLPEEETDVLICNRNGDIELARGSYSTEVENDFIWYTSGWRFGKVVAWMPLPKPYEPQESEDKE